MSRTPAALAQELAEAGIVGLTIVWADNNGIPRSRTVPVYRIEEVADRGGEGDECFAAGGIRLGVEGAHLDCAQPGMRTDVPPDLSQRVYDA